MISSQTVFVRRNACRSSFQQALPGTKRAFLKQARKFLENHPGHSSHDWGPGVACSVALRRLTLGQGFAGQRQHIADAMETGCDLIKRPDLDVEQRVAKEFEA